MVAAQQVKELREMTGAGMMDAKKALTEASGDFDRAKEILRTKGLHIADKKAGRDANEGLVVVKGYEDELVVAAVNCETDFVAKNEKFQDFVNEVADYTHEQKTFSEEDLASVVTEVGENIKFGDIKIVKISDGFHVATYIHNKVNPTMGRIGTTVTYRGEKNDDAGKMIAMHVASANPKARTVESLDQDWVKKEKDFLTNQALESGKPPEIVEKMIDGRMKKVLKEVCLEDQYFVANPDITVRRYAEMEGIEIVSFTRLAIGE